MITQTSNPVLIRPRRSLGGLYPDVVVEEAHEDSLEVTEHPVESGANVSDHAYMQAARVTIRAGVSDSSPQYEDSQSPSRDFYEKLLELMRNREPFDIITGKRIYKNMLLTRLSAVSDADTENALAFTAECREIIIAHTRTVTIPPNRVHKNAAKTGAAVDKGQKQAQEVERASIAYNIGEMING